MSNSASVEKSGVCGALTLQGVIVLRDLGKFAKFLDATTAAELYKATEIIQSSTEKIATINKTAQQWQESNVFLTPEEAQHLADNPPTRRPPEDHDAPM